MASLIPTWQSVAIAALVLGSFYALFVGALIVSGRTIEARAAARFVPDCVVLFRRLLADERVPRSRKLLLGATLLYLITPIDLVPDFIPIAGQADDAILVGLVLRAVLRSSGESVLREHWPGPERSLRVLLKLTPGSRQPAPSDAGGDA